MLSVITAACAGVCFLETYSSASQARADETAERLAGRDVVQVDAVQMPTRACLDLAQIDGIESSVGIRHLGTLMIGTPVDREVTLEAVAGPIGDFFYLGSQADSSGLLIGGDLSDSISEGALQQTLLLPRLPQIGDAMHRLSATDRAPVSLDVVRFPPMGRHLGSSLIMRGAPGGTVNACLIALRAPVDRKAPAMIQGLLGSRATLSSVAWLTATRYDVSPQDRFSARLARFLPFALVAFVALVDLVQVRARRREYALYRVNGVTGWGVVALRLTEYLVLAFAAVVGWTVSLATLALTTASLPDFAAARLGLECAGVFTLAMLGVAPLISAAALLGSPWEMLREP